MDNVSTLQPVKTMEQFYRYFGTEEACIQFYVNLRWLGCPICVKCGHEAGPFGEDGRRFRCKDNKCRKIFSYKVATVFENSKPRFNKWFEAGFIMVRDNVSSHQLEEDLGISQTSTWFMLHRLRFALEQDRVPEVLGLGMLQLGANKKGSMDEGTLGGANMNKHAANQRPGTQGRSARGKIIFVGFTEQNGFGVLKVRRDTTQKTLYSFVERYVAPTCKLTTDEHHGYNDVEKLCEHHTVNHGARQYVDGEWHSNGMENLFHQFFSDMTSTHVHISAEHAQAYADFFMHCWNTRKVSAFSRFIILLLLTFDCRLTYRDLTRKNNREQKLAA